jgi:hypothetical protein
MWIYNHYLDGIQIATLIVFSFLVIDSLNYYLSINMASIDVGSFIISLAKSFWEITRTSIDITINNQHPEIKLKYAARRTFYGGCVDAPTDEIDPETSTTIHLEANTTETQFGGVLLYKLMPIESIMTITSNIYLILCWEVTASKGLRAHMTLIEHDDDSMPLESDIVRKWYYYFAFRNELRKPNRTIRCSWYLGCISFTIIMTAGDSRFGKINVEIRESRSGETKTRPR